MTPDREVVEGLKLAAGAGLFIVVVASILMLGSFVG